MTLDFHHFVTLGFGVGIYLLPQLYYGLLLRPRSMILYKLTITKNSLLSNSRSMRQSCLHGSCLVLLQLLDIKLGDTTNLILFDVHLALHLLRHCTNFDSDIHVRSVFGHGLEFFAASFPLPVLACVRLRHASLLIEAVLVRLGPDCTRGLLQRLLIGCWHVSW